MATDVQSLPVVRPADHMPGPPQHRWTYDDYTALPDDGRRYEIVDGVLYMMPAPGIAHQETVRWVLYYLTTHVQVPGHGKVLCAPTDVELAPNVVVQPDVIVILNHRLDIITPTHIVGSPDLLVEIASPSTAGYDRREKQDAYARAGVPEYWIADPAARTVEVLRLEGGAYRLVGVFQGAATLPSQTVPELPVRVEQFFA